MIGSLLGLGAIVLTIVGLFLPWYSISASSQNGLLAQQGGVTLLKIDGINGIQVNLFTGTGADSTSGYASLFSLAIPFAILIAVGAIMLGLDIIGVRTGKSLGLKFITKAIGFLLPFVFIFLFINQLPSFLPFAAGLLPGQSILPQMDSLVRTVASNPIAGSTTTTFPIIGATSVAWGYEIGAYLFLGAAILTIIGGVLIRMSGFTGRERAVSSADYAPAPATPPAPAPDQPEKSPAVPSPAA
jgi:hypothetical protein